MQCSAAGCTVVQCSVVPGGIIQGTLQKCILYTVLRSNLNLCSIKDIKDLVGLFLTKLSLPFYLDERGRGLSKKIFFFGGGCIEFFTS